MHLALARKYRPQNFLEVIGQDPIVQTLKNAIETDRLHHAYLFSGVRGVGKTSMARILAKSINCETGPTITPCLKCTTCQGITQGNSLDVIEIDGASNNLVDDVRELREQVKFLPSSGKYKIYIIDEVHMLTGSAFNALLKTLEEPPAHIKFIFATTEPHKLPLTILSRCQKYDFKKLNGTVLASHLQKIADAEKINMDADALQLIAQCAQGSVRDALSLLDQVMSHQTDQITEKKIRSLLGLADRILVQDVFKNLIKQNLSAALASLNEVDQKGLDLKLFAEELLTQYRHLILMESTKQVPAELSPSEVDVLNDLREKLDLSLLLAGYQILFKGIQELSQTSFQKTVLEITFVKLNRAGQMIGLVDLVDRIQKGRSTPVNKTPSNAIKEKNEMSRGTSSVSQDTLPASRAKSWYDLVKWITSEKASLGSILREVIPLNFSDKKIEIGVPPDSPTKSMLLERIHTLEDMMLKHFGNKINLTITDIVDEKKKPLSLSEQEKINLERLKQEAQKEVDDNRVINELVQNYGAKIKEVKVIKI